MRAMKKLLSLSLVVALALAACGGGGGGEPAPPPPPVAPLAPPPPPQSSVPVLLPVPADGSVVDVPVKYWQSYRGSPAGHHTWTETDQPITVERLPAVRADFHSGYAYVDRSELVFWDHANGHEFLLRDGAFVSRPPETEILTFKTQTHTFGLSAHHAAMEACSAGGCAEIPILAGTWPYMYAEKNGAVLVGTNYGDMLLFRDGAWCRMTRSGDTYRCVTPQPAMLTAPRQVQFYSSVEFRERMLVGEWPTGRLYEFSGSELFPSKLTPPQFASGAAVGYEAQSMAVYCGDLYVGYWPRGEVFRLDHRTGRWGPFRRFFDPYPGEPFIPRSDRALDAQDDSFYGQRVTALVPFGDSLYAVTSNLTGWTTDVRASFLTAAQQAQYGAVYRIKRGGCSTEYL